MKPNSTIVPCDDVDAAIARYTTELDYRLEMVVPADSPVTALLSRESKILRLEKSRSTKSEASYPDAWIRGRAGMMYRDLIPGRLGGKLIASHIRLTEGGEVPDYVHYHKVRFQMIYCVRGAIKVVYEDQGEPFWLRSGDCVLQPPEIRHRVLWAEEGSEVVELGMPAVHETWVEHEITLPTNAFKPDREFSGQQFVRHIAVDHAGRDVRDTGIHAATKGFADVRVAMREVGPFSPFDLVADAETIFGFVISGEIRSTSPNSLPATISGGDAFIEGKASEIAYECLKRTEVLLAAF
jgi:quercetin dioxygenase-like cupin family protein